MSSKEKIKPQTFSILRASIERKCKAQITYRSRLHESVTEHVISPYGFIHNARHYLIAQCDQSNCIRTFDISNITSAIQLNEEYLNEFDFQLSNSLITFFIDGSWSDTLRFLRPWLNDTNILDPLYICKILRNRAIP